MEHYFLVKKRNSNSFLVDAHYDVDSEHFVGRFAADEEKALHITNKGEAEWFCYMANHISIDEDSYEVVCAPQFNNLQEAYYL